MKIHVRKTKEMRINGEEGKSSKKRVQQVDRYRHLESTLAKTWISEQVISNRIAFVKGMFNKRNKWLCAVK